MAIEVEDIVVTENPAEQEEEDEEEESSKKIEPEEEKAAPKRRGRPPGSGDKQPRKRALPPVAEIDDIEEVPQPALRRSATARPSRRVPIKVESEESTSAEGEEEEEPPTPRTRRHQEWSAYRQHKASQHQEQVNRYARLFDRTLIGLNGDDCGDVRLRGSSPVRHASRKRV